MYEFLQRITELCGRIAESFRWLADRASGIWVIGNWLEDAYDWVADRLMDIGFAIWGFADALWKFEQEVGEKVNWWDFRNWGNLFSIALDTLEERVKAIELLDILGLDDVIGAVGDFFDSRVKPWVEERIAAIPEIVPVAFAQVLDWFTDAFDWFTDFLYNPTGWVSDRVREGLPDIREILDNPTGWVSDRVREGLPSILEMASWPFLHALETFFNRIWWEEE